MSTTATPETEIPVQEVTGTIPDIRERLEAEFEARRAAAKPRTVTIQQMFGEMVALVASATGKRFRNNEPVVTEQTAVKILELSMGWAINSRNAGGLNPILEEGESGEVEQEDSEELPTPHEVIEAADDTAAEE